MTVLMTWVPCWGSLGVAVLMPSWVLSWGQLSFSGEDNASSLLQSPGQGTGLTQEHILIHPHSAPPGEHSMLLVCLLKGQSSLP